LPRQHDDAARRRQEDDRGDRQSARLTARRKSDSPCGKCAIHGLSAVSTYRKSSSRLTGEKGALELRKLGIIGGTSWSSTALYYDHINRGVAKRLGGLHRAPLVLERLDLVALREKELSGDWDGVGGWE